MKWEQRQRLARLEVPPEIARQNRIDTIMRGPILSAEQAEQAQAMKGPPMLRGKVIGFRAWTLDGYRLKSGNAVQHGGYWDIGPNRAVCRIEQRAEYLRRLGQWFTPRVTEPHDAPHPKCECGLYAFFTPGSDRGRLNPGDGLTVWGAVTAWGRIEVHHSGFRAEYAQPVALAYHPRDPYEDVVRIQALAPELGLSLVLLDDLPAEAAKHGVEVPKEMRPDSSPWSVFDELPLYSHAFTPRAYGLAQWRNPEPLSAEARKLMVKQGEMAEMLSALPITRLSEMLGLWQR